MAHRGHRNTTNMKATATVQTKKAQRYMKAMVNHFSQKTTAAYEDDSGYVEFGFGRCDIEAQSETLSFRLNGRGQKDLDMLKWMVDKHLIRFSQNEISALTWQS